MTVVFDGIASGLLLFLISVGLSVTLGLMNFVNLAHGSFAMLGGYVCVVLLNRHGVPFLAALPVVTVASARNRLRHDFFRKLLRHLTAPLLHCIAKPFVAGGKRAVGKQNQQISVI